MVEGGICEKEDTYTRLNVIKGVAVLVTDHLGSIDTVVDMMSGAIVSTPRKQMFSTFPRKKPIGFLNFPC